jgi:hypothetical protein
VEGFHAISIDSSSGASFQEEGASVFGDIQLEGSYLHKTSKGSLPLIIYPQIYRFATLLWVWRSYLLFVELGIFPEREGTSVLRDTVVWRPSS